MGQNVLEFKMSNVYHIFVKLVLLIWELIWYKLVKVFFLFLILFYLETTVVNIRCLPCLLMQFLVFICVSLLSLPLMYDIFDVHSCGKVC